MQVNIHEAKTHFSQLIDRALAGEEVIIARNGVALLSLKPVKPEQVSRIPGLSVGKGQVLKNFDDPLDPSVFGEFEK